MNPQPHTPLVIGAHEGELFTLDADTRRRHLHVVGQTGAGFSDAELGRVWKQLHALKTKTCPFATVPRTTRRAHWAKPTLVIDVNAAGWTKDGKLRRPTYAGLKADAKRERAHQERHSIAADTAR